MFISMMARRRVVDWQRAGIARGRLATSAPPASAPAALERYVDAHRAAEILRELGEDRRRVVLLAALHGFTHEEIARELSLPLGTVKSHYARAVAQVKSELQEEQ